MRWLCFLSLASPALAAAQGSGSPSLHFDFAAVPATRDSFVFHFRGAERGWAVWQFEIRPLEEERERVVLDRLTGAPLSTFHRIDLFSPTSDTVMMEHDPEVRHGEISGRRRIGTKSGEVKIIPVSRPFAPGTVLGDYVFIAGAVTTLAPGDSIGVPAYKEFTDSITILSFVAEPPTTIRVPAGRFDVQPLKSGNFRIFATRSTPRRVVKGATLDGVFA